MCAEDKEMIQNENKNLCLSPLQLPCDHRSLDVLRNYISTIFNMLSASSKEKHIFSMAGSEILSFILLNHVSPYDNELIMVKYSFSREAKVRFSIVMTIGLSIAAIIAQTGTAQKAVTMASILNVNILMVVAAMILIFRACSKRSRSHVGPYFE